MGSFLDVLPIVKPFCRPDAVFIETGTYKGEGLAAVMDALPCIYYHSIEANEVFFEEAERHLAGLHTLGYSIYHGDTVDLIPRAVDSAGPSQAVFFLDAHFPSHYGYAGVTEFPTLMEVEVIVKRDRDHSRDVIVIDDLLLFYGLKTEVAFIAQDGIHQRDIGDLEEIEGLLYPTHHVIRVMNGGGHLVALPKVNPNV